MLALPIFCSLVAALCSGVMFRDAIRRPRPDKVVWGIAFALFAIAAGADAWGRGIGWSVFLAKSYYASGVAMVVLFLAIGQLYLLFPGAMKRFGVGASLLISALWVSLVANAPVGQALLAEDGWEAIDRGPEMVVVSVAINSVGTLIIVGGTAWTAWNFWRKGTQRNRMYGCALILAGTIVVATGGSLTRFGRYEYLYIAMSIGIVLIFAGVLLARAPGAVAARLDTVELHAPDVALASGETSALPGDGLGFAEQMLMQMDAVSICALCAEWSVAADDGRQLARQDARRAWKLRVALSDEARRAFDAHDVPVRRQVSTLYHEILVWDRGSRDDIAEVVPATEGVGIVRRSESGAG